MVKKSSLYPFSAMSQPSESPREPTDPATPAVVQPKEDVAEESQAGELETVAEGREEEPSGEKKPEKKKKKKKLAATAADYFDEMLKEKTDAASKRVREAIETTKDIPLDQLAWVSRVGEFGQCRLLKQSRVDELLQSLRNQPPYEPVNVLVVRTGPKEYTIIGGQHIAKAVAMFNEEMRKQFAEKDIPQPLKVVRAVVLKENTSGTVLAEAAGMHQNKQRISTETTFSEVVEGFLSEVTKLRKKRCKKPKEFDAYPVYMDREEIWDTVRRIGQQFEVEGELEAQVCSNAMTQVISYPFSSTEKQLRAAVGWPGKVRWNGPRQRCPALRGGCAPVRYDQGILHCCPARVQHVVH